MKIRVARYRFSYRMLDSLNLPPYAGSLLRGQLGAMLKRESCLTMKSTCESCPLRASCPFPAVFEAPAPAEHKLQNFSHIPNPYVIEPPNIGTGKLLPQDRLSFNIVLIGRALNHLPLIARAMTRALEEGIGKSRAQGVLTHIEVENKSSGSWVKIWEAGMSAMAHHPEHQEYTQESANDLAISSEEEIRLHFITPVRLQSQGHPVRVDQLTPRKLIADLIRRTTLLAEFHDSRSEIDTNIQDILHVASTLKQRKSLQWYDWTRYSSRQKQEMKLGGAIGEWAMRGNLASLLPWLKLGQWLHVGKNATLGLGRYHMVRPAFNEMHHDGFQ